MEDIRLALQQLQCPFAEEPDSAAWLGDKIWVDLIAWLLRNFNMNMYESLQRKAQGNTEPSREQRSPRLVAYVLTEMASLLGLCASDSKLISGQSKPGPKADFLRDLSLLCLDSANSRSIENDLSAQSRRDEQLIAAIANDQKNTFPQKLQLFPLDMEPILKQDKSCNDLPTGKDLVEMVRKIKVDTHCAQATLDSLRKTVSKTEVCREVSVVEVERLTKSVALQLDQLYGLLAVFDDAYRNDFLPWMSQSQVTPSSLGPAAKQCHEAFKSLDSVLVSIASLKQSYSSILGSTAVQDLRKKTASMDEQRIATIREDIAVLERAAARRADAAAAF